ncbi:kallikrein-8-like [Engraulis encrasicolus]|uniref:kallikrein-8-like n=1 Tax=Engraulis encrasicolus TaxID=184585 RepID=UPI002FD73FFE
MSQCDDVLSFYLTIQHTASTTGPTPSCVELSVAKCPDFSGYAKKTDKLDKAFSYTEMVCAGTESDNTCSGAAGGGMVYNSMVYGVVKGSTKASCSGPIKFTSICPYRDWILKTRGKK